MKNKKAGSSKTDVAKNFNHVVDTESEFAAEFGEGIYGSQAREEYALERKKKSNKVDKDSMFKP